MGPSRRDTLRALSQLAEAVDELCVIASDIQYSNSVPRHMVMMGTKLSEIENRCAMLRREMRNANGTTRYRKMLRN